jgi:hypothetical protein
MTTAAIGGASQSPNLGRTVTIQSSFAASVQSQSALAAAQPQPTPPAPVPTVVVNGVTTLYQDQPGFQPYPQKLLSSQGQFDSIVSAAQNTAAAFGLNPTFWANTANIQQAMLQLQTIKVQPSVTIESIIIPP